MRFLGVITLTQRDSHAWSNTQITRRPGRSPEGLQETWRVAVMARWPLVQPARARSAGGFVGLVSCLGNETNPGWTPAADRDQRTTSWNKPENTEGRSISSDSAASETHCLLVRKSEVCILSQLDENREKRGLRESCRIDLLLFNELLYPRAQPESLWTSMGIWIVTILQFQTKGLIN